jgi:ABC-type amino acid transport substrate-binding protein
MNRPLLMLSVLLLSLVVTASARANDSARCEGRVIEQPFVAWDDLADYFLAPDGDFTGGAVGWELAGAEVVAENEPYYVHGGDVAAAVSLPPGASATSPTICVAETDPTMRLFVRSTGEPTGTLSVEVLYSDDQGEPQSLTIGVVAGATAGEWTPTVALPITVNIYEMAVAFRFTAQGAGSAWLIDDVFVDPYRKGRPE